VVLTELGARGPARFWLVDLDAGSDAEAESTLDAAEHARAARFVFDRDRRRYVAAHVALRRLLAMRTNREPSRLSFDAGRFGKPHLRGDPRCAFSLSHSGHLALVALADDGEIGVDLELIRSVPDADALAAAHFTAAERASLAVASDAQRDLQFLCAWTRKEACLKAVGCGLSVPPDSFETGTDMAPRDIVVRAADGDVHVRVESFRYSDTLWAWARTISPPEPL
jgi:4'-phosphopantetheinyl transferase